MSVLAAFGWLAAYSFASLLVAAVVYLALYTDGVVD